MSAAVGPNAKLHEEVAADHREFVERGLLVNVVEPLEVGDEPPVRQHLQTRFPEGAGRLVPMIHREHVAQLDLLLQPKPHIEPEQKPAFAQLHHVLRHAIVGGDHPVRLEQLVFDRAKHRLAPRVQPGHAFA